MAKPWIVRTTYRTVVGMVLGIEPEVVQRHYRWKWVALLRIFADNSFNAFNPPVVFGFVNSVLIYSPSIQP